VHHRRVVRTGEGEADGAAFVDGGRRRERRGGRHIANDHGRAVDGRAAVFVLDFAPDVPGAVVGRRAARSRRWAQGTKAGAVPAVEAIGQPAGRVHHRRVVRTGEGEADGASFVDGGRRRERRGG